MRRPWVAVAVVALTACTPAQTEAWLRWHDDDPAAAEAFLETPDGAALVAEAPAAPVRSAWDRIAWCESGGQWSHRPVTNRTGTYSGGLMIWTKAWAVYGGGEFAGQAWQATKAEQIAVAERILADRGWSAWDCA